MESTLSVSLWLGSKHATCSVRPGSSPSGCGDSSYLIALINDELLNYIVHAFRKRVAQA